MAWVYILECSDESFYVGSTLNLDDRLRLHNQGEGARYTARRRPVRLVWSTEYYSVADAFTVEKQIQGWSRAKRLALIEGRFADLPGLAKRRGKAVSGAESAGGCGGFDTPSASASDGSTT
jgi:putative endonuclease